jgi:hypothetical protein
MTMHVAIAILCLPATGGCAVLTGPPPISKERQAYYAADQQARIAAAAAHQESLRFLRSCGAMDRLDRLEVELFLAAQEAKYGPSKVKPTSVSQRCQDFMAHKITLDEAVAQGPGADGSKSERVGITYP